MNANGSSVAELARKPVGAFFHWEAPGEPIAVYFHLNIVDLLERSVLRCGDKGAAGVLLGRVENGIQRTFIVEDFEPIEVSALRSPSNSPFGDREVWKSVSDRWNSIPGKRISIVGFYRSSAPGYAELDESDLEILGSNPLKSEQIFLTIEPQAGKPCSGVLFLAKDGVESWHWDAVPFNRTRLARREAAPLSEDLNSELPRIQFPGTTVAEGPAPNQRSERGPASSPMSLWILGFIVGMALVAVGMVTLRGGRWFQRNSNTFATPGEFALGLRVQRSGNDVQLTWDRNAPILLKATAGRLSIEDGGIHKNLDLDLSELRTGSILYSPITDNVIMRLEVLDTGSATTSESVRIVAGLPPPLPARFQVTNSAPGPRPPSERLNFGVRPSAPHLEEAPKKTSIAEPGPRGSVLFGESSSRSNEVAQSVPPQPSAESFSAMPSAETSLAAGSTTSSLFPARVLPGSEMRASASTIELPIAAPPDPKLFSRSSKSQPARLISGKDIVYPQVARQSRVSGTVEVSFNVGADGKVRNFTSVKGPPFLVQPVLEAVQARRYAPATLNGNPVDSELNQAFVFKLQ